MKFCRTNYEGNFDAIDSTLNIVNEEVDNVFGALTCEDEFGLRDAERESELMDELAELRICQKVLKRLHHEWYMNWLEAAEYEEMYNDLEAAEYEEERDYLADFAELDELLSKLTSFAW